MKFFSLASIVLCSLSSFTVAAENWPQWRGPNGNGVAATADYPAKFSADQHVAWKVELPGRGSSTPAVWGEQIFLTCPIDGQDGVVCYDFAGKELWQEKLGDQREGKHRNGTGSNPSPVTDGQHLVVYYKSGTLACLDLQGKVQWQLNLQTMYGDDTLWWDLGTSPILADGNVVVAVMQAGDSFLVAVDLASGEIAWKQPREFECEKESDQSYTTPQLLQLDGREVIVTWGADHLTGHAADSGAPLWQCGGFNPENQGMWRVIASAAVDEEVAIVPYGRGEFLAGINIRQAAGDITSTHRLWEKAGLGADVPTPILHGQQLFLLTDKGQVYCLDKNTGDQLWTDKLPKGRGKYYASPVLGGDTLYCAREDGILMTAKVTDGGLKDITENDLGEPVIATPIPIQGQLLVRGEQHLFLFAK